MGIFDILSGRKCYLVFKSKNTTTPNDYYLRSLKPLYWSLNYEIYSEERYLRQFSQTTRMLFVKSKRRLARFISTSLFLFFTTHYTWLWYHSHVPTSSCEETLTVLERHLNHTSVTDSTRRQITHNLNETSLVSMFPRCERSVFVLIVVFSSPTNFERRSIIRSTWAKIKETDSANITSIITRKSYTKASLVKTVFLLGQANGKTQSIIESEAQYYNDLVIGSFTDTYGNLTLKTKLGLEWAQQCCKFKYYLKTDDDVFVYSKGVVQWLWQLPRERVYTGRCDFDKKVIRAAGHKCHACSRSHVVYTNNVPPCMFLGEHGVESLNWVELIL
mgnify:CR=1 FL=1